MNLNKADSNNILPKYSGQWNLLDRTIKGSFILHVDGILVILTSPPPYGLVLAVESSRVILVESSRLDLGFLVDP